MLQVFIGKRTEIINMGAQWRPYHRALQISKLAVAIFPLILAWDGFYDVPVFNDFAIFYPEQVIVGRWLICEGTFADAENEISLAQNGVVFYIHHADSLTRQVFERLA